MGQKSLRITLIPLNNPQTSILEFVKRELSQAFGAYVRIVTNEAIPDSFMNYMRSQYNAYPILAWLTKFIRRGDVVLGIAEGDAYVEGLNFVFGVASPDFRVAVVFLDRLRFGVRHSNRELLYERVLKEVMHELGHVFGLRHCSNPRCVMKFSNSLIDTDLKSWKYCRRCASQLEYQGIRVRSEYIL